MAGTASHQPTNPLLVLARFTDWWAKYLRQAVSRGAVVPFLWSIITYDLVDVFPAVRVPVLAVARAEATPTVAGLGDAAWRELLAATDREIDDHLASFGGQRVTHLGEGWLAVFDGPARAIRCATGIVGTAAQLGLGLRVGLHCGECETIDDNVQGIAVQVAARIATVAAPGEVLVSGTVRDLVAGSGIRFGSNRELRPQGASGSRTVLPVDSRGVTPDDVRRLAIDQSNVLRRDGECWTIAFDGQVTTVRDTKGLRDLARLLATPHREIHVLDLVAHATPTTETTPTRAAAMRSSTRPHAAPTSTASPSSKRTSRPPTDTRRWPRWPDTTPTSCSWTCACPNSTVSRRPAGSAPTTRMSTSSC